jgi:hypothetical protein
MHAIGVGAFSGRRRREALPSPRFPLQDAANLRRSSSRLLELRAIPQTRHKSDHREIA